MPLSVLFAISIHKLWLLNTKYICKVKNERGLIIKKGTWVLASKVPIKQEYKTYKLVKRSVCLGTH